MGGGIIFTTTLDLRLAALMFVAILAFTLVRMQLHPLGSLGVGGHGIATRQLSSHHVAESPVLMARFSSI